MYARKRNNEKAMPKKIKDTLENLDNMVYPCDDCLYNGGQYCQNDGYQDKFNYCLECEGWEEDEECGEDIYSDDEDSDDY